MPVSTEETVKSIGMKDVALFRQQVYIDGKWLDADNGETTAITNPSTGEVLGTVPNWEQRKQNVRLRRQMRPGRNGVPKQQKSEL